LREGVNFDLVWEFLVKRYGWIIATSVCLATFGCAREDGGSRKGDVLNVIPEKVEEKVEEGSASQKAAPRFTVDRVVYHYSKYDTSKVGYPSMGPGDDYILSAENYPEFDALIGQVLDETKVNDAVTLRKYLELAWAGQKEEVNRIDALGERYRAPSGSGVNRSFGLYQGEMRVYEFEPDLRRYSGEHVRNLYKLTTEAKNKVPAQSDDSQLPPPPKKELDPEIID